MPAVSTPLLHNPLRVRVLEDGQWPGRWIGAVRAIQSGDRPRGPAVPEAGSPVFALKNATISVRIFIWTAGKISIARGSGPFHCPRRAFRSERYSSKVPRSKLVRIALGYRSMGALCRASSGMRTGRSAGLLGARAGLCGSPSESAGMPALVGNLSWARRG